MMFKMTGIHDLHSWNPNANGVIKRLQLGSPYYVGIGKILKCMLLGLLPDFWGVDNPERKAGLGIENLTPHYDAQQVVIMICKVYSQNNRNLKLDISATMDSFDYGWFKFHNGDASAWIELHGYWKRDIPNRLSKRDGSGSATAALQYIDNAIADGLSGNSDDANAIFETGGSALNQWYAFRQDRAGLYQNLRYAYWYNECS